MRVQHFALLVGIAVLLPVLSYGTANFLIPPSNWNHFYAQQSEYDRQQNRASSKSAKIKITQTRQRIEKDLQQQDKRNRAGTFYVTYTIGLIAMTLSFAIALRGVAIGLTFGGLFSLAESYFYWTEMGNGLRFASLLLAFVLLVQWKFRPQNSTPTGRLLTGT